MKNKQQAEAAPVGGRHTPWTPGPWSTEKRLTTEITIRAADKTVIGGARCDSYLPAYEAEANARLIAAAPALLEALSEVMQFVGEPEAQADLTNSTVPLIREAYAKAISAIARAEGRVA